MSDTAVVSPTPEAPVTATPVSQEPVTTAPGTAETQGSEAAGAAPSEETFFSGDPNSLPPELQQAYKNMLKDYKQKTQSVAETRKKAEQFDRLSKDQRVVDFVNGLNKQQKAEYREAKAEVEKRLGEKISDEEFQKGFNSKEDYLSMTERIVKEVMGKSQKEIDELKQYKQVNDAKSFIDSFATELGDDGKALRPDFDSLDDPKLSLITGYLSVNRPEAQTQDAYREKLNEAYKWARGVKEHFYNIGKQEALQIIQKKAATSTEPPTNSAKGAYSGPDAKKLSVRDAFELAKKGIRVPRDD